MKFFKCIFLLVFLPCISGTGFSQGENSSEEVREICREDIRNLKGGVILVRLHTKQKGIDALREIGNNKLADKKVAEITAKNDELIDAFKTNFHFCEVYFFNSEYSMHIASNDFENAQIKYANGTAVPTDVLLNKAVYVAEVTELENFGRNSENADSGVKVKQSSFGFEALVIKRTNFQELRSPFPYYQRTFAGFAFINLKRSPYRVIEIWNERLLEYYNEVG